MILKADFEKVLKLWAKGIIKLGSIKDDVVVLKKEASDFIDNLYAYDDKNIVLFKPTKASVVQFRLDKRGAMSYFIGGDKEYAEDKGFALHPWKRIRFEHVAYKEEENRALVIGNYYFLDNYNVEVKAEYTFGFIKINDTIKIDLHHSSLPYTNK